MWLALVALLGVGSAATPAVAHDADDFDLRWRGVALADLPGPEAALLDASVALLDPARLTTTLSVSWLERALPPVARRPISASSLEDAPRHLLQIIGRAPRFATEEEPGTRDQPALGVVVVEARMAVDRSDFPMFVIVRESPLADLDLEIGVSLSDRLTFISDEHFGFARAYPSGVGALDEIRRPGYLTSLTPATELGRISRDSSFLSLSSPAWNRGKPFLPFEIPWVPRRPENTRRWYVRTRVAFHIWLGRTFSRGFNSYGCVTLRDDDLDELAALVFAHADPLPLRVRAPAFAEHRHPFPHEDEHHFVLENLGTAAHPRILRGAYYATKKLDEAPPAVDDMIGVFMDSERSRPPLGPVAATPATIPASLMP